MKYFRINKMFFYKYWPDKWWTRRGNPTERQVVQSNCSDDSVWPEKHVAVLLRLELTYFTLLNQVL